MAEIKVLIVDDEDDFCMLLQDTVERMGHKADVCFTVDQAIKKLSLFKYDVILTDLNLGNQSGLVLVTHVTEKYPSTPIAVMSAYGDQDSTVAALKLGAFDFLNKPFENESLIKLFDVAQKEKVNTVKQDQSEEDCTLNGLIGESECILKLKKRLKKIAKGQAPVFIQGESGAGKEVVANLVHQLSSRAQGPFIALNCGAIPEELLESELFGHKKGSFTGATQEKIGLIQNADGGSLFLDEIAELPLTMQVKLLRAVQEKKIRPVGSDKEILVDFRIISATHQNLESMVREGRFRQDLYFRLHVMDVFVPPLRERGNDVILLAEYICDKVCKDWGVSKKVISTDVKQWLLTQRFDGNVRELNNLIQRAITLSEDQYITLADLDVESQDLGGVSDFKVSINSGDNGLNIDVNASPEILSQLTGFGVDPRFLQQVAGVQDGTKTIGSSEKSVDMTVLEGVSTPVSILASDEVYVPRTEGMEEYLVEIERRILEKVMNEAHGSKMVAAKILKLTTRSLRYRLQKFGISSVD